MTYSIHSRHESKYGLQIQIHLASIAIRLYLCVYLDIQYMMPRKSVSHIVVDSADFYSQYLNLPITYLARPDYNI